MRAGRIVAGLIFVVLTLYAGVCAGGDSGARNRPSKLKLEPLFTHRLPSVPEAYWALPVAANPWVLVVSFQRPPSTKAPNFRASVLDWKLGGVLASKELLTQFYPDSTAPACQEGDPFRSRYVGAFENVFAVKLCSQLRTFMLPSLEPKDVLLDVRPNGALEDIANSADGQFLAVVFRPPASGDLRGSRKVLVFNTTSWELRATINMEPAPPYIHSVSLSRDGRYVAVASPIVVKGFGEGDHIYVFDTMSGDLVAEFDLKPLPGESGYHSPPYHFAGAESQWILSSGVVAGTKRDSLYVWDWRLGKVARVIEDRGGIGAPLDVSSDGLLVAADVRGDPDVAMYLPIRDFKIFNVVTGRVVYESPTYRWANRWGNKPQGAHLAQLRIQFSRDGQYIVDASGYDEVIVYSITR